MSIFYNIDWALLREQKVDLSLVRSDLGEGASLDPVVKGWVASLTGILHLLDTIQDKAVGSGEFTEAKVFALYKEE